MRFSPPCLWGGKIYTGKSQGANIRDSSQPMGRLNIHGHFIPKFLFICV